MTYKEFIIRVLDRRGSRWILGGLSSWYARRHTGLDIRVFREEFWIRSLGSEVFIVDTPTFDFFASDLTTLPEQVSRVSREAEDYWFHQYRPRAGDVVVDVGAGIGFETLIFSRSVGASGRVISVEAHPRTYRRLKRFCELNRLENTACLDLAVTDRARRVFIEDDSNYGVNSITLSQDPTSAFEVQGLSLDEICAREGVDQIDLLKMNIEGAERLAIEGMSDIIKRTRHVCIACHDFRSKEPDDFFVTRETVQRFLRRNDFDIVMRPDDKRMAIKDVVYGTNRSGFRDDRFSKE